jgi:predicted metal-dependent hydrolase
MEWKQQLIKAQKDYADAQTALKAKDKELEEAKFKPKSFQRRLQDEIKILEEKVNAQKNQVDEAKNMLEKVLPRQAEEYRADPSWVRVE